MKNFVLLLFLLIFNSLYAFADYKPISKNLISRYKINNRLNKIDIEILTKIRDFDKYEPVPETLQDEYLKKIPENQIDNFQLDMSNGLKHILYDKITYNHKTMEQMLLDFNKKSDSIYQEFLSHPENKEQNKIFIEQLKEMSGIISLYPNAIIEQMHPYIEKYNLNLEPGSESDIFLYKYYVEKYQVNYSDKLKELLQIKEYVYSKINIYILKISDKI